MSIQKFVVKLEFFSMPAEFNIVIIVNESLHCMRAKYSTNCHLTILFISALSTGRPKLIVFILE